jgi:hypothetical protein
MTDAQRIADLEEQLARAKDPRPHHVHSVLGKEWYCPSPYCEPPYTETPLEVRERDERLGHA